MKKVFISYAREDIDIKTAERLYSDLKDVGLDPWMDEEDLLPGQNWEMTVTNAIKESSFFLALLSESSVSKQGFVQQELKIALKLLGRYSPTDIFIIPVRLDDCKPVDERLQALHRVDLFRSYDKGLEKILSVLSPVIKRDGTHKRNTGLTYQPEAPPCEKPEAGKKPQKPVPFAELKNRIIEFLESLPDIHNKNMRYALIYSTFSDKNLISQIDCDGPTKVFCTLLVSTLAGYGKTEDGQDALEAVLETAKKYIGQNKQEYCFALIQKLRLSRNEAVKQFVKSEKPEVKPEAESVPREVYKLRSELKTLSEDEAATIRDKSRNIKNAFTDNMDGTITDSVTALVWQKSGADNRILFKDTQAYIDGLNGKKFAGHNDWRLPTLEELASLLESKSVNNRYIDPVFECKTWYWSADKRVSGGAWDILFSYGGVHWSNIKGSGYVRAIRSQTSTEVKKTVTEKPEAFTKKEMEKIKAQDNAIREYEKKIKAWDNAIREHKKLFDY